MEGQKIAELVHPTSLTKGKTRKMKNQTVKPGLL